MKLKFLLPILFIGLLITSCSNDDDNNNDNQNNNELENLIKVKDISNSTHTIELYNASGLFKTGYNAVSLRIKDQVTDNYVEAATMSWTPMMQMPSMQHSCPRSGITKTAGKDKLYEGYIIYQMTNTDGSGWSLTLNYTIDGVDYTATDTITVNQSDNQNVTSFMADDGVRYVAALLQPQDPIIGVNSMKVGLYKMENMMSFPSVEDYTIMLDPRMPGMGNHSSPNNTNLIFNSVDSMYHANLSLTMTGYWVLNLQLLNDIDEVLKGEAVTEAHPQSSFYLELEF